MKSIFFQFGKMDVVEDCVKDVTEFQTDNISCASLVHCRYIIIESHETGQAELELCEAVLAVSCQLLLFHVP